MNEADQLAEAHALTGLLFQVGERARADFDAIVGELGLTSVQARTVLLLEQPMPMRAVAEHARCDASNVTGLADRLERLGLVERVQGSDRRTRMLHLTERGMALRAELVARVGTASTVMARLTSSERAALRPLLEKLLGQSSRDG